MVHVLFQEHTIWRLHPHKLILYWPCLILSPVVMVIFFLFNNAWQPIRGLEKVIRNRNGRALSRTSIFLVAEMIFPVNEMPFHLARFNILNYSWPSVCLCCFHWWRRWKSCGRGMVVSATRWRDDSQRDLTPGSLALSPVPLCSWQQASIGSFSGKSVPLKQVANLYLGHTPLQTLSLAPFPPSLWCFPHFNLVSCYCAAFLLGTEVFMMMDINTTWKQSGIKFPQVNLFLHLSLRLLNWNNSEA